MSNRQAVLKRIEELYGMVEQRHSMVLQQAAALVREAETAIAGQHGQMCSAAMEARAALLEGDRQQWVLAGAQRELGDLWRQKLETVRVERVVAADQARETYGASRVKSEQVKSVVKRNEAEEEIVASRRAQVASDDRFLSRLRWSRLRFSEI